MDMGNQQLGSPLLAIPPWDSGARSMQFTSWYACYDLIVDYVFFGGNQLPLLMFLILFCWSLLIIPPKNRSLHWMLGETPGISSSEWFGVIRLIQPSSNGCPPEVPDCLGGVDRSDLYLMATKNLPKYGVIWVLYAANGKLNQNMPGFQLNSKSLPSKQSVYIKIARDKDTSLRISWDPPNRRGLTLFFGGFVWISKPLVLRSHDS